ncbi:MAG: hypothetical protein JWL89_649 [Candidatus Saccharibacteria bacterium]|nr:hypothetical protein [Candidatus Saccharibacteria bacterium]
MHKNKKAWTSQASFDGRAKANNFEPYIISLLHTLNKVWDTATYEKEIAPIAAEIDEYEGSNQIKGKLYAY